MNHHVGDCYQIPDWDWWEQRIQLFSLCYWQLEDLLITEASFALTSIPGQPKGNKSSLNLRSPQRENGCKHYALYRFFCYISITLITHPIPFKTGTCRNNIKTSSLTKRDIELLPRGSVSGAAGGSPPPAGPMYLGGRSSWLAGTFQGHPRSHTEKKTGDRQRGLHADPRTRTRCWIQEGWPAN